MKVIIGNEQALHCMAVHYQEDIKKQCGQIQTIV